MKLQYSRNLMKSNLGEIWVKYVRFEINEFYNVNEFSKLYRNSLF